MISIGAIVDIERLNLAEMHSVLISDYNRNHSILDSILFKEDFDKAVLHATCNITVVNSTDISRFTPSKKVIFILLSETQTTSLLQTFASFVKRSE